MYVKPFDPWKSKLCTCPPKYSFNPYTGCPHNCVYCYATYIPRFRELRFKKNLFRELDKDLRRIVEVEKAPLISMSNSSDPYPPIEKEMEITRRCLEIMKDYDVRVMIVTKSSIFTRDLDILSEMRAAVSVTITGLDHLERNAPGTEERIEAFRKLKDFGIPSILRFDPVVPEVNENSLWIIERCEPDHVVTSTLKVRGNIMKELASAGYGKKLENLYGNGERMRGYMYLPKKMRERTLRSVEEFCNSLGISCGFCREGIGFKAKSCDGSHLIRI